MLTRYFTFNEAHLLQEIPNGASAADITTASWLGFCACDSSALRKQLEHAIRVAGRLADRLSVVQQHYLLSLEERQNQRLSLLAIMSVVFLPLSLITGIYGMNFLYMPELNLRYGYPLALGAIVAIGVGLAWLLNRRGWFR